MKRILLAAVCVALLLAAPASAVIFFDDFEGGVSGSVWTPWSPAAPGGINNLLTSSDNHNITPGGTLSARAHASDPAAWNGYADFGANGGKLEVDVALFEDFNEPGTDPARPVAAMLALFGDSGGGPGAFSDYLQLGVVDFFPSGNARYGFRTRYNDATGGGIIDTGVSRKAGWTELEIQVDPLSDGGQVRFYIDEVLVGSSFRAGANGGAGGLAPVDLRWVRLGNNRKSYENFWYDDVEVTVPEPASLAMLCLGGIALAGYGARRRRSM